MYSQFLSSMHRSSSPSRSTWWTGVWTLLSKELEINCSVTGAHTTHNKLWCPGWLQRDGFIHFCPLPALQSSDPNIVSCCIPTMSMYCNFTVIITLFMNLSAMTTCMEWLLSINMPSSCFRQVWFWPGLVNSCRVRLKCIITITSHGLLLKYCILRN